MSLLTFLQVHAEATVRVMKVEAILATVMSSSPVCSPMTKKSDSQNRNFGIDIVHAQLSYPAVIRDAVTKRCGEDVNGWRSWVWAPGCVRKGLQAAFVER